MSRQYRTTGDAPLYRQLAHEFAARILEGELAPGAALPTVRALADERGIDRGTVMRAYALLAAWDLVISEGRRGTCVRGTALPSEPAQPPGADNLVRCAGSHDFCLDVLARLLRPRGVRLTTRPTGSSAGLAALAAGTVDIAGSHNHYGMTEMGLGGGVECQARRGYHLREADLLFEIVDPASGAPLPEGEAGEVVVSTLTREGMPLIRYRTGDAGRFLPGACPCGTALRTLERVTHRLDGRLALGRATLTMADLDEAIFPLAGVIGFSAALTRGPPIRLAVELEVAPGATGCRPGAERALKAVPALARACGAGELQLTVAQRTYDPARGIALRKRVIGER
jgi:hypothetical protein